MGLGGLSGLSGILTPGSIVPEVNEAASFISAAVITDSTQISALEALVAGIKTDSMWSLIEALYPFVGGTAASHSWNLKNTATNRITWGNATHSAAGVTLGNQANTTNYTLPNNRPYLGTYITGGANANGADFFTGNTPRVNFYSNFAGTSFSDLGDASGGRLTTTVGTTVNRYAATTRNGGISYIFSNATTTASGTTASATMPTNPVMRFSDNGGDAAPGRRTALCVIAQSLTPAQHVLLYNRIQAFQVALGRAV